MTSGRSRIDQQRVDRDVGQAVAGRPPGRAVVVALPDAARHAGREQRRRHGRVESHDARAAADVAGPERRPRIEHAGVALRSSIETITPEPDSQTRACGCAAGMARLIREANRDSDATCRVPLRTAVACPAARPPAAAARGRDVPRRRVRRTAAPLRRGRMLGQASRTSATSRVMAAAVDSEPGEAGAVMGCGSCHKSRPSNDAAQSKPLIVLPSSKAM